MSEDIRSRSVKLLQTSLSAELPSTSSNFSQLASSLEEAIFHANGSSTGNEYRDAVRQRSLVLKKDNPDLAKDLLEGKIGVEEVARATSQQLQSSEQSLADSLLQQENIQQSFGLSSNFDDSNVQGELAVTDGQREGDTSQLGLADAMLGGEGEFASRKQPKVGKAMEGIEFETP